MMEINLLPWREAADKNQRSMARRNLFCVFFFPAAFLMLQHVAFHCWIQNQRAHVLRLSTQLDGMRNQTVGMLPDEKEAYLRLSVSIDSEERVLRRLLKQLGSLDRYHIHLMRMNYSSDRMDFIGTAASMSELRRWEKTLPETVRVRILSAMPLNGMNALKFHAQIE
jgi:hypothetical protein